MHIRIGRGCQPHPLALPLPSIIKRRRAVCNYMVFGFSWNEIYLYINIYVYIFSIYIYIYSDLNRSIKGNITSEANSFRKKIWWPLSFPRCSSRVLTPSATRRRSTIEGRIRRTRHHQILGRCCGGPKCVRSASKIACKTKNFINIIASWILRYEIKRNTRKSSIYIQPQRQVRKWVLTGIATGICGFLIHLFALHVCSGLFPPLLSPLSCPIDNNSGTTQLPCICSYAGLAIQTPGCIFW